MTTGGVEVLPSASQGQGVRSRGRQTMREQGLGFWVKHLGLRCDALAPN